MRVVDQTIGVVSGWYNPVDELADVSLAEHGLVEHLAWSVVSPRDAASGLPTGKRQHKPLVFGVRMSAATVHLGNALRNNSNLTTVQVLWFSADPDTGVVGHRLTLVLTNANIASLGIYTARAGNDDVTFMDVSFAYQKVGIEDHDAGVSYEDDWESPIAAPQLP